MHILRNGRGTPDNRPGSRGKETKDRSEGLTEEIRLWGLNEQRGENQLVIKILEEKPKKKARGQDGCQDEHSLVFDQAPQGKNHGPKP